MRAQLVEGEVLEDHETLVRLSAEIGVPADAARATLSTNAYADEVNAEIREAAMLGCTGVPFFVIDRRYAVSGAQPAEVFLQVLERAGMDAA
jgi:predicted DsbA family dithiol-disulfide isomerase